MAALARRRSLHQEDHEILVVDDDPAIRDVVVLSLALEGYPVVEASNGREALEVLEECEPYLLLLDMNMPVLDGWGLARELNTGPTALTSSS